MQLVRQGRTRVVWIAALGALIAFGTVMIATAQDDGGGDMIYACIDSRNGALYGVQVDVENVRCSRGDDRVGWALGEPGPGGATGLSFGGSWESGISYLAGVIVEHEGSSYVSIAENPVVAEPPDETYWQLLAMRGADGADGEDGEDGAPGPSGLDGADGEDGEQGPQGPEGPRGLTGEQGPFGLDGEGFAWRGEFDPAETYARNDVVHHEGSAWVAGDDDPPSAPGSGSGWELFARGFDEPEDGTNGDDSGGGIEIVRVSETRAGSELSGFYGSMDVSCPASSPRVVGGGFQIVDSANDPVQIGSSAFDGLRANGPVLNSGSPDVWRVAWSTTVGSFTSEYLRINVTCMEEADAN